MEALTRHRKRVCYTRSVPEWFGHTLNDLFFREVDWVFVPLQDLPADKKQREYRKASYFLISGYEHAQEAVDAHHHGAILVGARLDVPAHIPIIACDEWHFSQTRDTLKGIEQFKLYQLPPSLRNPAMRLVRAGQSLQQNAKYYFGLIGYFSMATKKNFRAGGLRMVIKKFRNYFWGKDKTSDGTHHPSQ